MITVGSGDTQSTCTWTCTCLMWLVGPVRVTVLGGRDQAIATPPLPPPSSPPRRRRPHAQLPSSRRRVAVAATQVRAPRACASNAPRRPSARTPLAAQRSFLTHMPRVHAHMALRLEGRLFLRRGSGSGGKEACRRVLCARALRTRRRAPLPASIFLSLSGSPSSLPHAPDGIPARPCTCLFPDPMRLILEQANARTGDACAGGAWRVPGGDCGRP